MARQQPEYVDAMAYLVIEPEWGAARDDSDRPILRGAKVSRVTQSMPKASKVDALVTRITFRVDANALLPMQPSAVVHITANDVEVIEVEAEHPDESQ